LVLSLFVGGAIPRAAGDELDDAVSAMARVRSSHSPSFSPDGKTLAFVTDLSGVPQVWSVPASGGWPTLVTALDDQVLDVSWSPQGDWLAFSVAPGGGMNQQVYLIRPDGTGMRRLTDGGKENNWLGFWSHDGRRLAIASNRRGPASMDAYLFELAEGGMRLISRNPGIGSLSDVSRDGKRAVLYRMESRGSDNLILLDLPAEQERLLTAHSGPGSFGGGLLSPDGSTVYLSSNKDRDLVAFAQVQVSPSGDPGPIQTLRGRDDAELDLMGVSEDGATAALVWNLAGKSELEFFDLRTHQISAPPPLPAEIVSELAFSRDGKLLALTVSGAASPRDVWILDRVSGRYTQVTHSPHPGVDLTALARPELVRFRAHDGLELSGWLYRPRASHGPGPAVLSFHGGPEGQAGPVFSATYHSLLARGIAVFTPNVRGSSGFGKRFVNLDNGALRVNSVNDIRSCVEYLVRAGVADPKRVGIMGGSYGGYMTMAGLAEFPDLFAAGADLFGVVNFETFFAHTEPWMAAISTVEYGDPKTQGQMLRDLSPIHRVERVKAPTIVLHGANDTNVPVVEAEQVVENLKKRGVPVEYVLFPDEGHGFQKTVNRVRSTTAIVRWFAKYL
jgi:dipeptidyl aminopeptidase/acylaminoacyl peptidase